MGTAVHKRCYQFFEIFQNPRLIDDVFCERPHDQTRKSISFYNQLYALEILRASIINTRNEETHTMQLNKYKRILKKQTLMSTGKSFLYQSQNLLQELVSYFKNL